MTYKLRTIDGKHSRVLNDDDFMTVLRLALKNGWKPSPKHLHRNKLFMNRTLEENEAKELAGAIDRSVRNDAATLLPPIVVAFLECIGVLRRGKAKFVKLM